MRAQNEIPVSYHTLLKLLKALANEKRFMIVLALSAGEKNVGELEQIVRLSQSALSQHLARLRQDDIVETRRMAQTIYYSIKNPKIISLLSALRQFAD